ncbi:hypothetical protein PD280_07670 [Virgibacillus salarius]|uniref:hypothetical protein n=1 Tax=Virgibacillus salarius TaxID=447199 RepID=UPI002490D85E|nr:hypothetical protein [Virgibacillus salarius]WBX81564.1 hypothetical protein PD280_07670 [Virgibacillus salarius]
MVNQNRVTLFYLSALLTISNFVELIVEKFNSLTSFQEKGDTQVNPIAGWITVLIAVIIGGLTIAGLMWACQKFGGGRTFLGEFKILGASVKIKCG